MNKYLSLYKKVYVHPLLFAVVAIAIMTAHFKELLLLLLIIIIHELGHLITATHFSWRIKRITLLPFGGVAEMDEHSNRPFREELLVTIAGPLQHLWLISGAFFLYEMSFIQADLFTIFIKYNLMIVIFNLLPIWPLDGGKLLLLFLSLKIPFLKAYEWTIISSVVFLTIFTLLTIVIAPTQLNVWIVLLFLLFSLTQSWRQRRFVFFRFLLERYYGKSNSITELSRLNVDENERVIEVLERFQCGCKHLIVVKKDNRTIQSLDENELLHSSFTNRQLLTKIGQLLYKY